MSAGGHCAGKPIGDYPQATPLQLAAERAAVDADRARGGGTPPDGYGAPIEEDRATITKSEPIVDGALEYEVRRGGDLVGIVYRDAGDARWSSDFIEGESWQTLNEARRAVRRHLATE